MTARTKINVRKMLPLQKAAILITALDRDSADRLLEQMLPAQTAAVRNAVLELDDVDVETQQAVLEEFFANSPPTPIARQKQSVSEKDSSVVAPRGKGTSHVDTGVELMLQSAAEEDDVPHATPRLTTYSDYWNAPERNIASEHPLAFLSAADGEVLLPLLEREHPQTVAVVLANLPPRRAAELLEGLPPRTQNDVVRRMLDLEETDPQVLREVAQVFSRHLEDHLRQQRRRANGVTRLANILAVADDTAEERILSNLDALSPQREELSPRILAARQAAARPIGLVAPAGERDLNTRAAGQTAAPQTGFREFCALSADEVLQVLQHVESESVVLALAGAEAAFIERIARRLPADQGRLLKRALAHLGPVKLIAIEAAQNELVRAALQLGVLRRTRAEQRQLRAA